MGRRHWSARDVLDATSFHAAAALLTAASLGVFDALAGRRATAAAVARRVEADPAAVGRLLGVLQGMRLLVREGAKYGLAPGVRDLLAEDGERSLAALLRHRAERFAAWARLEESLRGGRPVVVTGSDRDDPAALRSARARRDSARVWAPVLAAWLDLGRARSLLLAGEGTAVYAYHFARLRPGLSVTVVDGPASVAVGAEFLAGRPERKRIRFVEAAPGAEWELPGRTDAAFLSDALHRLPPDALPRMLRGVRKELAPGGRLFVRDRFLSQRGQGDVQVALYDLQLLLTSESGRCSTVEATADAVRAAGFLRVVVRDPGLGDGSVVICGRA